MARSERPMAVGVFRDRSQAERAIEDLHSAGFNDRQIGMVMRDESATTDRGAGTETDNRTAESAGGGVLGGGILGGILGAAAAGAIPGIGPLLAVGTLAGVLGGAAVGGAAGGIVGALTGQGVPEEEARYYEEEVKAGRPLVTVETRGRYDEAMSIIRAAGGSDATGPPTTGTTTRTMDEERHP